MTVGRTGSAFVEQEDNVNMEHLGKWKEKRKIDQSSGGPVVEYKDFIIHEYIMVCGETNSVVWASSDQPT